MKIVARNSFVAIKNDSKKWENFKCSSNYANDCQFFCNLSNYVTLEVLRKRKV